MTEAELEEALKKTSATFRQAFRQFIKDTRSDETRQRLTGMIRDNNIKAVTDYIDSYSVQMGWVVPSVIGAVTSKQLDSLKNKFKSTNIVLSFDPTNPRAAEVMRRQRDRFIREITEGQREAIRDTVANGLAAGKAPRAIAREVQQTIGLTEAQRGYVASYQRSLEQGSADALNRAVRDRRFDSTVRATVEGGDPLTADQIIRMTERYRDRMLALRAETIARTEAVTAVSVARQEAFEQALEQTNTPNEAVERVWRISGGGRTRDSHAPMDRQVRGLNEPFTSGAGVPLMYPGDSSAPAGERINCRCVVVYRIKPTEGEFRTRTAAPVDPKPTPKTPKTPKPKTTSTTATTATAAPPARAVQSARKLPDEISLHKNGMKDPVYAKVVDRMVPLGKVEFDSPDRKTSFYRPSERMIHMVRKYPGHSKARSQFDIEMTWRHEYGHHIDYNHPKSKPGELRSAQYTASFKKDYSALTVKKGAQQVATMGSEARAKAREQFFKDTNISVKEWHQLWGPKSPDISLAIQMKDPEHLVNALTSTYITGAEVSRKMSSTLLDMLESVTKTKYGRGHGKAYYDARPPVADGYTTAHGAEAFAQWFTLSHGHEHAPILRGLLKKLFPNTDASFKTMLTEVAS